MLHVLQINNMMATHRNRFPDYEDCVVTAFKYVVDSIQIKMASK